MISKENLFSRDYTHVENWKMNNHNNKEEDYEIITYPDAVFVFALTDNNQVLLLDQYSVAAQERINHLVAGYVEDSEKPIDAAKRELEEETGYVANSFQKIGVSDRSTWATGDYIFFLAKGATNTGEKELDSSEDINVEEIEIQKIKELLKDSDLHAVGSVACAYKALNYLGEL